MTEAEITNYDLLHRIIQLSDAIQRLADAQNEQGKMIETLSDSVSSLTDDVGRITESLPDN
jgi:hypothetical protein